MRVVIFWLACLLVVMMVAAVVTGVMVGAHPLEILFLIALAMFGLGVASQHRT